MSPRAYAIPVLTSLALYAGCTDGGDTGLDTDEADTDTDTDTDTDVDPVGRWDGTSVSYTDVYTGDVSTFPLQTPYAYYDGSMVRLISLDVYSDATTYMLYTWSYTDVDGMVYDYTFPYGGTWSSVGARTFEITDGDFGTLTCVVDSLSDNDMVCDASDGGTAIEIEFVR